MNGNATVAQALDQARGRGVAMLDARLMLGRLLGRSPTWLIAHDDERLGATTARWAEWLGRRADGEPLAYLLGEKEFHGLLLEVTPEVLVPRPETELLVDWAVELLECSPSPAALIDLGTGSGAIALAVKQARPDAAVTATDASAAALAVARRNARRLGLEVDFVEASWWQGLEGRRFQVAAANPPYIREGDPALAALRHEPPAALTPGGDGLAALREIASGARAHLDPGGWLLLEHGFDQAGDVRALLEGAGLEAVETRFDLAGHPRATGGCRPVAAAR
jgi:release factor glutamine methyltransferase